MNKKIILLAVALMLFAGVVSASSINGDYKGNPIVKITSGDRVLETDEVPGFIYEGHTVVPISTLRQLGASVTWDAYGYSVDVKLPLSQASSSVGNATSDVAKLKAYAAAADFYRKLAIVGTSISTAGQNVLDASNNTSGQYQKFYSDRAEKSIAYANDFITQAMNSSNTLYEQLLPASVDISDVKSIILEYSLALKTFGSALDGVQSLNYQKYGNNWDKALESLKEPRLKANEKYFEYFNRIQNY